MIFLQMLKENLTPLWWTQHGHGTVGHIHVIEIIVMLFFLRFYLFIHDRHRERAETQAEREAGSTQGS